MEPLPTQPEELTEVLEFLRERFEAPADADFIQPDHARWKYLAPRPDWDRPRSYILRMDNGRVGAHCCICPIDIWVGERRITSFHLCDRAGDPKALGASMLLGMMLMKEFDTFLGIGGNDAASRIAKADKMALPYGTIRILMRSIRPFRRSIGQRPLSWKSPMRLGRDLAWNLRQPMAGAQGWSAEPVQRFSHPLPVYDGSRPSPHFLACFRSPELLNNMLDCPGARFTGFLLRHNSTVRGHVLLCGQGSEVRIVDLSTQSDELADWAACYAVATRAAAVAYPAATQVSAAALPPFIQQAMLATGFRLGKEIPVRLADKRKLLTSQPLLPNLNLMDWDEAYLF